MSQYKKSCQSYHVKFLLVWKRGKPGVPFRGQGRWLRATGDGQAGQQAVVFSPGGPALDQVEPAGPWPGLPLPPRIPYSDTLSLHTLAPPMVHSVASCPPYLHADSSKTSSSVSARLPPVHVMCSRTPGSTCHVLSKPRLPNLKRVGPRAHLLWSNKPMHI